MVEVLQMDVFMVEIIDVILLHFVSCGNIKVFMYDVE